MESEHKDKQSVFEWALEKRGISRDGQILASIANAEVGDKKGLEDYSESRGVQNLDLAIGGIDQCWFSNRNR